MINIINKIPDKQVKKALKTALDANNLSLAKIIVDELINKFPENNDYKLLLIKIKENDIKK